MACLWWSFPQSGNGLPQPLDSSLRWNDGGGRSRSWRAAPGVLGGLFLMLFYHGSAELAERPASL